MDYLKRFIAVLLAIYCFSAVLQIALQPDAYQWDFQLYYTAAKDLFSGADPYAPGTYIVQGNYFPACYPPLALGFYGLFALFDYRTAFYLFLFMQVALLAALVRLWAKKFFNRAPGLGFYALLLFAFNASAYLGLRAGNICFLEQLLIWLGLYWLSEKKYLFFVLAITAAAQFKLAPVLFLFLLALADHKQKTKYLLMAFLPFAATLAAQYLLAPAYFAGFLRNVSLLTNEGGIMTPSTFSLTQEVLRPAYNPFPTVHIQVIHLVAYLLVAGAVLAIALRAFKQLRGSTLAGKERWYVLLAVLVYVLISMRFKDYSYIILIVPAYFILCSLVLSVPGGEKEGKENDGCGTVPFSENGRYTTTLLAIILVLSAHHITLPYGNAIFGLLWSYYPIFLAYLLFGLYISEIKRLAK